MYANSFVETFTIHQGIGDNGVADARLEHTIKTLKTACMIVFFLMFFFFLNKISYYEALNLHATNFPMRCDVFIRYGLTTARCKLKTFHSAALRRTCQTAVHFVLFSLYWVNVIQVRYSYKHFRRRIGKRLVLCSRTLFIKWIHTRIIQYTYLLSKYTWHLPGFPFNEDLSELHIFLSSRKLLRWFQIRLSDVAYSRKFSCGCHKRRQYRICIAFETKLLLQHTIRIHPPIKIAFIYKGAIIVYLILTFLLSYFEKIAHVSGFVA